MRYTVFTTMAQARSYAEKYAKEDGISWQIFSIASGGYLIRDKFHSNGLGNPQMVVSPLESPRKND